MGKPVQYFRRNSKKLCINWGKLLYPTYGMPSVKFLCRNQQLTSSFLYIPVHSCHSGSGRNEEAKSTISVKKLACLVLPTVRRRTILPNKDQSIIACGSLFLDGLMVLSTFDWHARIFCISKDIVTKPCLNWGKLLYPTYEMPSMKFSS